ncbi:MAG: cytochrome P450 [Oligoflexus sp.]
MKSFAAQNIPQPKPVPLIGNVPDIDPRSVIQSMMRLAKIHGPIYRLAFPSQNMLVVSSQRLVNELCDESRFDKKVHSALAHIRDFVGDGLFTAYTEEANWGRAHRILMPAFGPVSLKNMFDSMLDIAEQMLLKWERLGEGVRIDVADNMTRLTLDTIALCAFDYRFNSFYEKAMHPLIGAMLRSLLEAGARGRRLPLQNRMKILTQRQYQDDVHCMQQVADELIAERRKQKHGSKKDLLSLMLECKDPLTGEGLSDTNIRHQLVTFLIAGHETTSGMLSFTLYELLKNPAIMERARREVDEVLGQERPGFEHLSKLKYLDQILKESLRLWPTAPGFAVYPYEETVLAGTYPLDSKQTILVLLPMLHRDPEIWGADPERFDPDRFTPEAFDALPANSWKPFGNGQRACIGRPFAMQEATLVLAMLLQRFDCRMADPDYQLCIKETLTMKPHKFFIHAKRRAPQIAKDTSFSVRGSKPKPRTRSTTQTQRKTPVLVVYGSNSGTSQALAQRIASDSSQQRHPTKLATLDAVAGALPLQGAVIIVCSSYEGLPPDNAREFLTWLGTLSEGSLAGLSYAVFGCGNRDWTRTYQAVPQSIDAMLAKAGGRRLKERGEGDARSDFLGDFEHWYSDLWGQFAEVFALKPCEIPAQSLFELEFVDPARDTLRRQNDMHLAVVLENRELVDLSSPLGRSKRHIELALPPNLSYQVGDYLVVLPVNPSETVHRVLSRFGLTYDAQVKIHIRSGHYNYSFIPAGQAIMVGELLSSYLEIGQPATRLQIKQILELTRCPPERGELAKLLQSEDCYIKNVLEKRLSVLDLLERSHSCELTFAAYLEMLPPLKPRPYSISSSPTWKLDQCSITFSVVRNQAWSGHGRHLGVASNYLASSLVGSPIAVSIRPTHPGFQAPTSASSPLIMVAAGSGIAPFRGFL